MARVQVLKETAIDMGSSGGWTLWFQWCRYVYDGDGGDQRGYRFIWRRPQSEGASLQAARGQARIPSVAVIERLVAQAKQEGWGHFDADEESFDAEAAAKRLRKAGLVVDPESGYVGWPSREAAEKGRLTQQMIEDEKLIRERVKGELIGEVEVLDVAENLHA